MNKKEPTYVIQWSHRNQMFHVETPEEMLEKNREIYFTGKNSDYLPVALADGFDHAVEIIEYLETHAPKSKK